MINLDQITSGVLRDRAKLTPSILAKFDDGLLLWLCLIDLFDHSAFPTKVLISSNFENAKNEIFNEIHVSITLAYHLKFRAAAILTRSCIELSCYALYFVDHPADCLLWSDNVHDLSFGTICEKIFAPKYYKCVLGRKNLRFDATLHKNRLSKIYRELSECVHGKPGFMSTANDKLSSSDFACIFHDSAVSLLTLAVQRLDPDLSLKGEIPALENLAHE